jgi:hypothetical protein
MQIERDFDLTLYPPRYACGDEEMEPEEQGQEKEKEQKGKKEDNEDF